MSINVTSTASMQRGAGPDVYTQDLDVRGLERSLRDRVDGEVRFDAGSRALYASDGSNYRHVPLGVVVPRTVDAVTEAVTVSRRYGAPIVSRGGGTGLTGSGIGVAVIVDHSKYLNHTNWVDPEGRRASVEPGKVYDHLNEELRPYGLVFPPDTSTHEYNAIGGMLGNNSCGVHSIMGHGSGRTSDQVRALDVLTYDGCRMTVGSTSDEEYDAIVARGGRKAEIYRKLRRLRDRYAPLIRERFPKIPRRVSGYNLDDLLPEKGFHVARSLVGSEGTCVAILGATLDLVHNPPHRALLVLGYPSIFEAADHVPTIMGYGPVGLEGIDRILREDMLKKDMSVEDVKRLPEGNGWLLAEFGGETHEEAVAKAEAVEQALRRAPHPPVMKVVADPDDQHILWQLRESGLGATARVPALPDTWEGWEDAAVAPEVLGDYLRDFRALLNRYEYHGSLYGHFGQGCVHTRITFDFTSIEGVRAYRSFLDEAADLVARHGGSFTGEHGDGQSKSAMLPKLFGPELVEAFREFKSIWDPMGKMNPGKVVDPYAPEESLRLGPGYRPDDPPTIFKYTNDHGSLAYATERCVGVGKCRKDSGTMCPSYMVTREEKHSTRGRAHLLNEMLRGDTIRGGFSNTDVKEALDLCLACKACKTECPMDVDMATYKAEFMYHHHKDRLRPRAAYSMGLIHWWARLASAAPTLSNALAQAPGVGKLAQVMGGITTHRDMPAFAPMTFRRWWAKRPPRNVGKPPVILWADTFNNHFHPQTAIAAVEVLEDAGFEVLSPRAPLCCGRPLYDFGFLETAQGMLRQILGTLHDEIRAGVPIVGLEPSCVSVFRDEMTELFPRDHLAHSLSRQTFTLGEFLRDCANGYEPPQLNMKAILHGHCHHEAIMGLEPEMEILGRAGLDFDRLDSGCCGLAGSFGYEPEKYEVSVGAGERVLAPTVREADPMDLVIADGFSCRQQVAHLTDRGALHTAQVLQMALHEGPTGSRRPFPEQAYEPLGRWNPTPPWAPMAVAAGAALMFGGALGGATAFALSENQGR
ncbi:FAD-linked oxidase C-terminal domain-containing protein [Tautonia sp. JC769]|uniref:FAD-binding and (Fe-S)-binding domain-containing protein n=1 Tax=Tautonia sp. JC769 TaxID=3232135 RepID=UPI00345993B4